MRHCKSSNGIRIFVAILLACIPGISFATLAHADGEVAMPERGICAHRGASATHPENTLAAFHEAIRLGAQMIEFDVFLTKDKQPVLMHDPTVDRTTDGKGRVADLTLLQIKKLDAGSWKNKAFAGEAVPTLAEAMAIFPRNVWLNIHLKEGRECGEAAARAVVKAKRLHQAFLACNADAAAGAHAIAPEILICNMERQGGAETYVNDTIARNAQFIQLTAVPGELLPKLVKTLTTHKIRINYFGPEGPQQLRALFAAGIEFPLVNDVLAGHQIAAEFGIQSAN